MLKIIEIAVGKQKTIIKLEEKIIQQRVDELKKQVEKK